MLSQVAAVVDPNWFGTVRTPITRYMCIKCELLHAFKNLAIYHSIHVCKQALKCVNSCFVCSCMLIKVMVLTQYHTLYTCSEQYKYSVLHVIGRLLGEFRPTGCACKHKQPKYLFVSFCTLRYDGP